MFDGLKGMAGIAGLMKDLPRLKEKMEAVKERLGQIEVSAETGGGAVKATVNCKLRVVDVSVDPIMMGGLIDTDAPEDRRLAEELIAGAINAALEKAQERAAEEFATAAEDLGLPLPPGGLQGLM